MIASSALSIVFGVVPAPTHRPIRNGSLPHRSSSLATLKLAGAQERRGALELLQREHAERVAHEHRDARPALESAELRSKPTNRKRESREPEIRLGLSATGRKPEQIDERLARSDRSG